MLKNNNKDVIRRLNRRMLKSNRLRNVVTIVAIILTTFMFTTIFSIGYSLANNVNEILLLGQGSRASVYLTHPTAEQIEAVKACSKVRAAGLRIKIETLTGPKGYDKYKLMWFDETEYEQNLKPAVKSVKGSYPEKENEIMLSTSYLTALGYDEYAIGDTVKLYGEDGVKEFVLSGYYSGFSSSNPCLVSEAYATAAGKTVSDDGYMSISSKADNNEDMIIRLEEEVPLNDGQKWDNVYDVQVERGQTVSAMIVSMCLISLLVVISGYLLIYNVMYISVAKDIRFYGMLKTIGTSSSQIKRLVRLQSLYLSVVGIPLGLILGTVTSFGIVPLASYMVGADREGQISTEVTLNMYIYLFAIAFAAVTVFLSVRKPAILAAKVSPIEALRYYAGDSRKKSKFGAKRTDKEYTENQKVRAMAVRNVFRDKKRARLVFASLFFGSMVFLCVNTFIKSLSPDNFLASYFFYDYALFMNVDNAEMAGNAYSEDDYDTASGRTAEEIADDMANLDGLEYCHINRYANAGLDFDRDLYMPFIEYAVMNYGGGTVEEIENMYEGKYEAGPEYEGSPEDEGKPKFGACVVSVDSRMIEDYNKKARHKIDIERFNRGEVCLVGYVQDDEASGEFTGKVLSLKNEDTGINKDIEVGATAVRYENYGIVTGYTWAYAGAPQMILVSDIFMNELFPDAKVVGIVADAKKGREPELATLIYRMYKANNCIEGLDIKSMETEDFKKSMMSLTIVGGGISGILILIGLMNFVNVMLTSVYTRSKEIATLESVGMTKKQLKKMLVYEGMTYGGISLILILSFGSIMIYATGLLSVKLADYAVPKYPLGSLIILALMIIVICAATPIGIFNEITKQTVTERIRD